MGRDGFEKLLRVPDIVFNENRSGLISKIPGKKSVRLY